ncbi:MAG: cytidylate kinase family protein [Patescibacteria group bacterium]|nr:cytidylate kinase family protein [Patescibacteria group bacterium]
MEIKYRNITISGLVCTGTSTLSRLLAEKLGWNRHSSGELFRQYCLEHNLPIEQTSLRPDSVTLEIDNMVKQKLQKEKYQIMEGWLTGFLARDIDGVFKILLVCGQSLRIDRLVNRDNIAVEAAKEHIEVRERENFKKWQRIYKTEDFWDPKFYDLVIDTYASSKEETLQKTLDALGPALSI